MLEHSIKILFINNMEAIIKQLQDIYTDYLCYIYACSWDSYYQDYWKRGSDAKYVKLGNLISKQTENDKMEIMKAFNKMVIKFGDWLLDLFVMRYGHPLQFIDNQSEEMCQEVINHYPKTSKHHALRLFKEESMKRKFSSVPQYYCHEGLCGICGKYKMPTL